VEEVLAAGSVEVKREAKRGERIVDIRSGLNAARVLREPLGLHLELACTDEYMVKPDEVVEAVNRALARLGAPSAVTLRVHRERLTSDKRSAPRHGPGKP
jgi:hypothetical protein